MDDAQILQQAITAIKSGDKVTGQKLLLSLVKANPNHEIALLWLSVTTDDITKKRQCFERVITINPNNEAAKRGLAELQQKQVTQPKKADIPVESLSQQAEHLPEADSTPSIQPSQTVEPQLIDRSEIKEPSRLAAELPPQQSASPKPLKSLKREATKKCPYCAETIKADANVCRFCGRDLTTGQHPSQDQPVIIQQPVQQKKKGNPVITFLAALGLVGLLFCVCLVFMIPSASRSNRRNDSIAPATPSGPTPTPIIYDWEGEGDDVIFFDIPAAGTGLVNAWYGGDSNFAVTLYRADGEYIDLLVNTIDEYDGKTTYRVEKPGQYYLEIHADGNDYKPKWHIIMAPPQ